MTKQHPDQGAPVPPDFRALCAELADELEFGWPADDLEQDLIARARAALAQPVPPGPTDEELSKLLYYEFTTSTGHGERVDEIGFARAVLARWGNPTPQPVPVSEWLPKPGDVNEDGEVWILEEGYSYALGDTGDYDWEPHRIVLRSIGQFDAKNKRTWLPAHALPTPGDNQQ